MKSIAMSCQGPRSNPVMWRGSGLLGPLTTWHPWHVLQNVSASLSMPGHQSFVHKRCFIFAIPWCPSWPNSITLAHTAVASLVQQFWFLEEQSLQRDTAHLGLVCSLHTLNSPNFLSRHSVARALILHLLQTLPLFLWWSWLVAQLCWQQIWCILLLHSWSALVQSW